MTDSIVHNIDTILVTQETTEINTIKQFEVLNVSLTDNSKVVNQYVAGEAINGHRAVVIVGSKLYHADCTNLNHINKVIGVSLNAGSINDTISVQSAGDVVQNSWGLTQDSYYYFDNVGMITTIKPTSKFIQILGYAKDSNTLVINKSDSIGLI